ncbi:DUF3810 domain-containing protein [Neptunitalea lumnitzerae]|uniref:Amino acid permease n=1 Tax=Neptunitalea lumnitzerae TaxID=2965509 RepID=A0ABQ5MKF2_9FLAO|nr:DUF3810 domain-containing protein [Neptunitalea sp. Y10]GLB49891.1 hypothetical protein Y10_22590 [Neptunitalea sp. Y10]
MSEKFKTLIAFSIIPQIFLVKYLGTHPDFVEKYYSTGIYQFISKISRYIFGWVPFSIGDILYTILGLLICRFFYLKGRLFIQETRVFFKEIFVVISIAYALFHFLWAFNYYRLPLHESLQIKEDYTTEELKNFTTRLIAKANEVHLQITGNDSLKVTVPYTKQEIFKMTQNGYDHLAEKYPQFSYHPTSVKKSLYSKGLTYMGYSGYLNPFTNEAQVNGLIYNFKFPTTTCHEIAHQLGYSAENEANFIGYLAAVSNDDIYFKYSAYIFVLRYCLGELRARDEEVFESYNTTINYGIILNYMEVAKFWSQYQNKAEPVFKSTYNTFLKANKQKEGIKSYNYVISLLVNYYTNREL